MRLTVYFLRHGETESSRTGTYCGVLDSDLTPEGHETGAGLCRRLQRPGLESRFLQSA